MKYLIFSDIHGSSYYMEKVLNAFEKEKCDKLICLGDLLYHGPRNDLPHGHNPKEVVRMINNYKDKIVMVKGNCEAEVDQMVLDFPIFDFSSISDNSILLTHGHHINPENPIDVTKGSIVFYGHTHVSKSEVVNGVYYINPGSVSLPKLNTKHSFVILEETQNKRIISWVEADGQILEQLEIER